MKVKELIRELTNYCDPEMDVVFSYDYGDYVHTQAACDIVAVREHTIISNEFHGDYKVCLDDSIEHEEARLVVVLSEDFIEGD